LIGYSQPHLADIGPKPSISTFSWVTASGWLRSFDLDGPKNGNRH
jgi:hypothetical protein